MCTIFAHSFQPDAIARDWTDFTLQWHPVLKWTLVHGPTGSALVVNDAAASRYMKLFLQLATAEVRLP